MDGWVIILSEVSVGWGSADGEGTLGSAVLLERMILGREGVMGTTGREWS